MRAFAYFFGFRQVLSTKPKSTGTEESTETKPVTKRVRAVTMSVTASLFFRHVICENAPHNTSPGVTQGWFWSLSERIMGTPYISWIFQQPLIWSLPKNPCFTKDFTRQVTRSIVPHSVTWCRTEGFRCILKPGASPNLHSDCSPRRPSKSGGAQPPVLAGWFLSSDPTSGRPRTAPPGEPCGEGLCRARAGRAQGNGILAPFRSAGSAGCGRRDTETSK